MTTDALSPGQFGSKATTAGAPKAPQASKVPMWTPPNPKVTTAQPAPQTDGGVTQP